MRLTSTMPGQMFLAVLIVLRYTAVGFPVTEDHTLPEQNKHLPSTVRLVEGKHMQGYITGSNEFLIEGDIIKNDVATMKQTRMSVKDRQLTWTGRNVPYKFKDGDYSEEEKTAIRNALSELQSLISNCVKFNETSASVKDYLVIKKSHGCYSSVGRIGGEQTVSLAAGCLGRKGTIYHEMMHALGFWHEHNRPDRDSYITILTQNIKDDHRMDFDKGDVREVDTLNQPYDLESVMHYSQWTFSKYPNDRTKKTFTVKNEDFDLSVIGQRTHLSHVDINKIKALYKCEITQCKYPGDIADGRIQGVNAGASSPVGTWVSYTCNAGYTLAGPDKRMCKYNSTWTGFQPECLQTSKELVSYCSFQQGLCTWKQDTADDFDWTSLNKRTDTELTGPTVDNTYEGYGGSFMYMESSAPLQKGQKARLISGEITPNSTKHYIKFFYHMFGNTMGTLNVYMRMVHPGAKEVLLASVSGDQGNTWHMKDHTYAVERNQKYNVIFEGVVGVSYLSDIGVDDVIIKEIPEVTIAPQKGGYKIFDNPFKSTYVYKNPFPFVYKYPFQSYLYHGVR